MRKAGICEEENPADKSLQGCGMETVSQTEGHKKRWKGGEKQNKHPLLSRCCP